MSMTKPQRVRWDRRWSTADDAIDTAIAAIRETFEWNPVRPPTKGESRQDECEAIAANALQEAIGCLEGARSGLASAHTHLNWEATKVHREWTSKMRVLLDQRRAELPADVVALLDTSPPSEIEKTVVGRRTWKIGAP